MLRESKPREAGHYILSMLSSRPTPRAEWRMEEARSDQNHPGHSCGEIVKGENSIQKKVDLGKCSGKKRKYNKSLGIPLCDIVRKNSSM